MSVLRRDPTSGGWVIVAPGRADRPHVSRKRSGEGSAADCPLCPGHEEETPPEILRIPAGKEAPWAVRVVPNKFAVLAPNAPGLEPQRVAGLLREAPGTGHHEVVVEGARHGRRLSQFGVNEVALVLDAYHARYTKLRRDPVVAYVIVFKNCGRGAGASLAHPHSQIVATPMAPLDLERRYTRARDYYTATGRCLYRDVVQAEVAASGRLVRDTPGFVVFCPFASGVPFETWIVPKRHQASFGATSEAERMELAGVLRSTLGALDRALRDPDFNYVLDSAPIADEEQPYYLWHVRILPRITTLAGFELGTGIPINITFPEEAAASLRDAWPGGVERATRHA